MKNKKILFFIMILPVFLSGCSISVNTGAGKEGALWRSDNRGEIWNQRTLISNTKGTQLNINNVDVNFLTLDPSDHSAIYLGSFEKGMFFSYDKGDSWQSAGGLKNVTINSIAVDPKDKCNIYVATGNKLYKSIDCSRTWNNVYYDNDPNIRIRSVVVDHYRSNNVFIATTRGEIIKSADAGANWKTIYRASNNRSSFEKMVMSPRDSRVIFAATKSEGLMRTTDGGKTWTNLSATVMKDFKDIKQFRDITVVKTAAGATTLLATGYGLLLSRDNGSSWTKINLITPEKDTVINAIGLNPKNDGEIYYITNTTFYRSLDGGKNWATKKIPSTVRAGWRLLVDPESPGIIYLGLRTIEK